MLKYFKGDRSCLNLKFGITFEAAWFLHRQLQNVHVPFHISRPQYIHLALTLLEFAKMLSETKSVWEAVWVLSNWFTLYRSHIFLKILILYMLTVLFCWTTEDYLPCNLCAWSSHSRPVQVFKKYSLWASKWIYLSGPCNKQYNLVVQKCVKQW